MRDAPTSISHPLPSKMSRDPDGDNLPEDYPGYSSQLEPSGSRYDDEQVTPMEDARDEGESKTVLDIKKIVGVPPPPPTSTPPKRRKKKASQSSTPTNGLVSAPLMEANDLELKETEETGVRDDCDVKSVTATTEIDAESTASSPKEHLLGAIQLEKHCEKDVSVSTELDSAPSLEETTIVRDNRESPTAKDQEEAASVANVTKSHPISEEGTDVKGKNIKRKKKRGFFKKIFGGAKTREESQTVKPESKPVVSASADQGHESLPKDSPGIGDISDDKSIEVEETKSDVVQESEAETREVSLDPPGNDRLDPPENPDGEHNEHQSEDSEPLCANGESKERSDPLSFQIRTDKIISKDPVGMSPIAEGNTEGDSINQTFSGDPQGETPGVRENSRISSFDPVGTSFSYASRMKSTRNNKAVAPAAGKSHHNQVDKNLTGGSKVENRSESKVDLKGSELVSSGSDSKPPVKEVPSKKTQIDIEKSGFKSKSSKASKTPLTVSAAAFTNAKAIAYFHQLEGAPSPRRTWHSNNVIAPPLSEESIALAKIRAFSSKSKKGKVQNKKKFEGPSPDDYSAANAEIGALIKEDVYVSHDPSKQFAPYSRFKGRRPRKSDVPIPDSPSCDMPETPSQESVEPTIDLESIVPSGKLARLAIERGIELRQMKQEGLLERAVVITSQKNTFNFFPLKESEIKNPIQRAGRRLLSKAAVPIQASFRMFLSRREAMDRLWAIIKIQSYFRRWKCEANLHAHKRSSTLVQKVYRGYRGREEVKHWNACATTMQKIVRGYLASLRAYETIYYISRAQALARGFLVRTANARKAAELKEQQKRVAAIIIVQSIVRRRKAIRTADLIKKSIYSHAITRFQALWRGYAERDTREKLIAANRAATKIQASWRGFQAYSDFIFAIVDILVVQRTARQWLAVQKTKKLRQERAAIVLQSAWRRNRAQVNLMYSLVHIILAQSVARRFLAKNQVETRRKKQEQNKLIQRKKDMAATIIQKSWRGFWGFSHFVIVRYETTRIQALIRGKLARNSYNLKLGCAILIQAAARRFLARKAASDKVIRQVTVASRALELRERNSAIHIQFWWRIVLDWMKEKKAALVIERFFIYVKSEVDRELRKMERQRIMNKKKSRKKSLKGSSLEEDPAFAPPVVKKPPAVKKNSRSQSAPHSRLSQKNLIVNDTSNYKSFQKRDSRGFMETDDWQSPPDFLQLAPSADFSMVSNLTNPSVLNQLPSTRAVQPNSEELYQEVRARSKNEKKNRLSTEDYIKKYGGGLKTAPNKSLSKSQSQHFFSEDGTPGGMKKKRQSFDGTHSIKQRQSLTPPREGRGHYGKPMPLSTGFEAMEKTLGTPRRSRGGSTPRNSSLTPPRGGSTPRNSGSTPRNTGRSQFLPPVTPTRKKSAAILRTATAVTECSTPVESEKMYIPPRPRPSPRKHSSIHGRGKNAVMIMKTNPGFRDDRTIEEAHEIMLLGDDYGEV